MAQEWHFDPKSRQLYIFPPPALMPLASSADGSSAAGGLSLLLTQTDALFEITGSSSDKGKRVENIVFANLSFGESAVRAAPLLNRTTLLWCGPQRRCATMPCVGPVLPGLVVCLFEEGTRAISGDKPDNR